MLPVILVLSLKGDIDNTKGSEFRMSSDKPYMHGFECLPKSRCVFLKARDIIPYDFNMWDFVQSI